MAYQGPPPPSHSPTYRPRLSFDNTCSRASDIQPQVLSPGPPSPSLAPHLVPSRCSSRAQSEASTALLEELRACGLDPEGGSDTPSPTLSQLSTVNDEAALNASAAGTANVTIRQPLDTIESVLLSSLEFFQAFFSSQDLSSFTYSSFSLCTLSV